MTTEQAEAFAQLRTLAAASRLRVRPDDEGWPIIPGRLGQIEYHDGRNLAVFTDRPRLHAKLWAIPGVRRHQTGDREMRALFPHEALEQVAGVIRARRRRIQSLAQTQNLAKHPRSAVSRPQDRTEAGTLDLETSSGAGGGRHGRNPTSLVNGGSRRCCQSAPWSKCAQRRAPSPGAQAPGEEVPDRPRSGVGVTRRVHVPR